MQEIRPETMDISAWLITKKNEVKRLNTELFRCLVTNLSLE